MLIAVASGAIEPRETESDSISGGIIEHVVVRGDTVFLIATHYGSTVDLVIGENEIEDVRDLEIGTHLWVPVVAVPDPERAASLRARAEQRASDQARAARTEAVLELVQIGETQLAGARYRSAQQTADRAREALASAFDADARPLRARLELVSATAQIAMGDANGALASMQRALRADPSLVLESSDTSPKVMAVFHTAQSNADPSSIGENRNHR